MPMRKFMAIAWPSFLAACVLQALVFGLVDPLELELGPWSRQTVYTVAFLLFWLVAMLSSALTVLLAPPTDAGGGVR